MVLRHAVLLQTLDCGVPHLYSSTCTRVLLLDVLLVFILHLVHVRVGTPNGRVESHGRESTCTYTCTEVRVLEQHNPDRRHAGRGYAGTPTPPPGSRGGRCSGEIYGWQRRAASAGAGCRGSSHLPVSWRWLADRGVIVARVHARTRWARLLVRNHTPSVSAARPICTTYTACSRRRKPRLTSATCTGVDSPARQLLWRLVVVVAVVAPPAHRSSQHPPARLASRRLQRHR